jgi:hypothetical protein
VKDGEIAVGSDVRHDELGMLRLVLDQLLHQGLVGSLREQTLLVQ